MHNTVISAAALERGRALRGETSLLALDPARTAHVVVDLQVGFMAPGSVAETPMNLEILAKVDRISAALRAAGGVNVFLRFTYDPGWSGFYGRFAPGREEPLRSAFTAGAEQHALWPQMDVQPQDLILDKTRFSALIPGTCDLDAEMKARGIDTLVVTGCVSNCCCESTIRDAVQMNYKVVFVQDGNAAASDSDHNGAVADLYSLFGCDISTADEVVKRIKTAASGGEA
ncbi:MAG: cysteine hydrolase [Caulobacteraceae bacterium]|nr:cysteine hydrolase [Caulobacteraceae bacterium]